MGFGSLATAFYTRELITQATLNSSHGQTNPTNGDMRYFQDRLEYHKESVTEEFKTMLRAVEAVLKKFPGIKRDVTQANKDPDPLISKIRKACNLPYMHAMCGYTRVATDAHKLQIMKGAHAARTADANRIRNEIFILSHDDAEKRGWTMPATIEKSRCGIKSDCTARFLLPFDERDSYLKDPEAYREKVERNEIKLSLSGTWPAILYDESMVDSNGNDDSELAGLFRSETLLRCAIAVLCSPSAGRQWTYPEPGARSFASSRKESNAEINGIKEITPETIAYISTLAVFAVHDSDCFTRNLGGIDLSELYHDVVATLRLKTNWTTETLKFWNSIIFGDRVDDSEEQKTDRRDRFRQLEAKQREKEGLPEIGVPRRQGLPAATPRQHPQTNQDSNGPSPRSPRENDIENEDPPPSHMNKRKKRPPTLFEPEVDLEGDPVSEPEGDSEDEPATPPQRKKMRRRPPTASPQGFTERIGTPPVIRNDFNPAVHVTPAEWEEVREELKTAIWMAIDLGLKELATEFTTLIYKGTNEAVAYYNENHDRIEWQREIIEKKAKQATTAHGLALPKKKGPTPEQPTPKRGPKPAAQPSQTSAKKKKKARGKPPSANARPSQKITRSVSARARQLLENDNGALTDLEDS